jgi:hypothetical protein
MHKKIRYRAFIERTILSTIAERRRPCGAQKSPEAVSSIKKLRASTHGRHPNQSNLKYLCEASLGRSLDDHFFHPRKQSKLHTMACGSNNVHKSRSIWLWRKKVDPKQQRSRIENYDEITCILQDASESVAWKGRFPHAPLSRTLPHLP